MLAQLTRRGFLVRAAVAGLAAVLPARGTFAARKRLPVYALDPFGPGACASCASCNACIGHGANKLFDSRKAADAHRAHPNCDCAIRLAGQLPTAVWFALFGPTRGTTKDGVVDRRNQRVFDLVAPYEADLS